MASENSGLSHAPFPFLSPENSELSAAMRFFMVSEKSALFNPYFFIVSENSAKFFFMVSRNSLFVRVYGRFEAASIRFFIVSKNSILSGLLAQFIT
jgi:hypothetical protein